MKTSSVYRHTPGLLTGVTLLLSCFLFSGCDLMDQTKLKQKLMDECLQKLFGEHRDQFPSLVLLSEDEHKASYEFNWDTTTIAGASINKFIPSKNFWRLHVFSFTTGKRIDNLETRYRPFKDKEKRSVTFTGLPMHELLRADLELADDEKGTGKEIYNFMVLFHYEKTLSK